VLAVPGDLGTTVLLRFNKREKEVHREQTEKVQRETGLSVAFQRDLAECRLEPAIAKLLFYSYRMAHSLNGQPAVDFACGYLEFIGRQLDPPPADPLAFWTRRRLRYLQSLLEHRAAVAKNLRFAINAQTKQCINDFLGALEAWGVR